METKVKQIAKVADRSVVSEANSKINSRIPDTLNKTFTKGKITFLTLRGNPKTKFHQKLDFASRFIKKLKPSAFYIVKEEDHRKYGDGLTYHYHALLKNAEKPKKGWYRKGIHIHYLKVPSGRPVGYQGDGAEANIKPDDRCVEERLVSNAVELLKRDTSVVKLLTYFSKDQTYEVPVPKAFINYTFQIGKKETKESLDYSYKNVYL